MNQNQGLKKNSDRPSIRHNLLFYIIKTMAYQNYKNTGPQSGPHLNYSYQRLDDYWTSKKYAI